ncbi:site-2 protease family protein [Synechococcus sp. PCC 7336]|uniref:site-2 protease family protein n=1 Tax=Synechococcus sp. PCC 7336 TaxID=195250 RepID=UPI00034DD64D|nr:site-2 protease family protein [Synechococcus sp. PCC 7336]
MNPTANLTPALVLAAIAMLAWGLIRARRQGKAGLLAWLQSLALLLPWLIFLGLFATNIYLGAAGFVLLLAISTGIYIGVGRLAREVAREEQDARKSFEAQFKSEAVPPTAKADVEADTPVAAEGAAVSEAGDASLERRRSRISAEDLAAIQSIFGIDTFYVTETLPYGDGAIFQGNLRQEAALAVARLQENLRQAVGDRYWLYLVYDPTDRPAVVVLPDATVNSATPPSVAALAGVLFVASSLAVMELAANVSGFSLGSAPQRWLETLPFASAIIGIVVLHEWGHRWMAAQYGVRLSPAFLVPTLGLGTLGSLNRIESPVPSRQGLFDIAIAGPALGFVLSLLFAIVGLWLSGHPGDIFLPSSILKYSILMGALSKAILGSQLQAEVVGLHPLVLVGWMGLVINALSLLPAGQLDGGRIVQAVYGRKMARRATFVTIALLCLAAFSNQIALYWGLLVILVARDGERPPQDEITETDGQRDALALLALFLMAMTLLPIAPTLAGQFGLGAL